MIRFVTTTSLLALLLLVLYLPSATPPERFLDQLHAEYALAVESMGRNHATHIVARMLDLQFALRQANPAPSSNETHSVDRATVKEMTEVHARLFNNPYSRSIDTLLALAAYRFATLREWFPAFPAFILAALFDGFLVRIIKSKEFLQHDPEMFALHVCAAILTACAMVIAFVLPMTMHPLVLAAAPIAIGGFVSRALANFHRRA